MAIMCKSIFIELNSSKRGTKARLKYSKLIGRLYKRTLDHKKKCPNEIRSWHGAFVLFRNKIISYGINHSKGGLKKSVHAEKDAIRNVPFCYRNKMNKFKLIVIRLSRDVTKEETLISKPCHKCSQLIEKVKIPIIFYSV